MNPLKYVLTFTLSVFFTITLLAKQNPISVLDTDTEILTEEFPKVSAAEAVSLFNFFKVETVKQEAPVSDIKFSESKLKEFFDYFILLSRPIP